MAQKIGKPSKKRQEAPGRYKKLSAMAAVKRDAQTGKVGVRKAPIPTQAQTSKPQAPQQAEKKKKRFENVLTVLFIIIVGGGLMAYPFISNYIFEHRADSSVTTYENTVDDAGEDIRAQMIADAVAYNEELAASAIKLHDPFSEEGSKAEERYLSLLSLDGSEIMGFVKIPCIGVSLPIYHGTNGDVLEKGVGHLEGTSLPVGGSTTHCVLTGHTGLSSAKMFTGLTQMEVGDLFILEVLGEKLAYEVDQILTVTPDQVDALAIVDGEDYCTLVTCTPYGVNTHRLFVRGHRTEYVEEEVEKAEASPKRTEDEWTSKYANTIALAMAIIFVCVSLILLWDRIPKWVKGLFWKIPIGLVIAAAIGLFFATGCL